MLSLKPDLAAAHGWLGELSLEGPGAEARLSRAVELEPGRPAWRLYRGASRLLRGRPREALEDLVRAERQAPRSALARLLSGVASERLGRKARARLAYRAAARLDPACSAAYWLWSRCESSAPREAAAAEGALDSEPTYALILRSGYKSGEDWRRALLRLRALAFRDPGRVFACVNQEGLYAPYHEDDNRGSSALAAARDAAWSRALKGRSRLRSPASEPGRGEGARDLERAIARSPGRGWLRAWRGLARLQARRPEAALRDFDACIRLQPFYYRCYAWRGALRRRMGRTEEALADLDVAVSMDPSYAFAIHERSLAYRDLRWWAGAAAELDRAFMLDSRYGWVFTSGRPASARERADGLKRLDAALRAQPRSASLAAWRAQLLLETGLVSEALAAFSRAVYLDAHHGIAFALYGRALDESGSAERACAMLERAVVLEPRSLEFQAWLARARGRAGDLGRAAASLRALVRAHPADWRLRCHLAEILLAQGLPRPAGLHAREAIRLEGRHADAYYLEARIRAELRDWKSARRAADQVIAVSPHYGRAYLLRASIAEGAGRPEEAIADYRLARDRFPELFNEEQKRQLGALLGA